MARGGPLTARPAPRWLGPVASLAVAALFLVGTLRPGYLLVRDFVTVPDPVLGAAALGRDGSAPRAVPLDILTALLDPVLPSAVQQRVLLVGSVVLLGAGAAALVRPRGSVAVVVAAVVATWNPYVVERLLMGQAPTLLGIAALPWLALATRSPARRQALRVAVAAAPAALTPFGGVLALVVVAVVGAWTWGIRRTVVLVAVVLAWCLPWVVPAVLSGATTGSPEGARAFAVRDDSAAGLVGSVVTWGGIWAPGAHLESRESLLTMLASALVVLAVALAASTTIRRRDPGAWGLVLLWVLPLVVVLVLSTGPGLVLLERLQGVPGVALLRDTHRLLGLSVLGGAVLLGSLVARAARAVPGTVLVGGLLSVLAVVVLTAPDAPRRLADAYTPVDFPPGWESAVEAVPEDAEAVLVLPWQPIRPASWGGHVPFLDPVPRALRPRTLVARELTVTRDGEQVVVPEGVGSGPWSGGDAPTHLDDPKVDAVWWWGAPASELPRGFEVAHASPDITVWRRTP